MQNRRQFCNLKGIFNALNKVLCLASAMECAEGDNKIVFTSPEAMVEFFGEKVKPRCSSKPFEHIQIIFV